MNKREKRIKKGGYVVLAKKDDRLYIAENGHGDMMMVSFERRKDDGEPMVYGWFIDVLTNEQLERLLTKPDEFIEEFDKLSKEIKPQWHAMERNWLKWDAPNWPSMVL